jgi:protein-disulfide isomerase
MRSLQVMPIMLSVLLGSPAGTNRPGPGVAGVQPRSDTGVASVRRIAGGAPQEPVAAAPAQRIGGRKSRIVIEEYSDFECPYCAAHENQYGAAMDEWVGRQKGKVRLDFYDVALRQHHFAAAAARAARCAGAQGRYSAARHALFAARDEWARAADAPGRVAALARGTVRDSARFERCLATDTAAVNAVLAANLQRGRDLGIPGTPTFVISVAGKRAQVVDPVAPDSLQQVIRSLESDR